MALCWGEWGSSTRSGRVLKQGHGELEVGVAGVGILVQQDEREVEPRGRIVRRLDRRRQHGAQPLQVGLRVAAQQPGDQPTGLGIAAGVDEALGQGIGVFQVARSGHVGSGIGVSGGAVAAGRSTGASMVSNVAPPTAPGKGGCRPPPRQDPVDGRPVGPICLM